MNTKRLVVSFRNEAPNFELECTGAEMVQPGWMKASVHSSNGQRISYVWIPVTADQNVSAVALEDFR